jgi:hypothetical protein
VCRAIEALEASAWSGLILRPPKDLILRPPKVSILRPPKDLILRPPKVLAVGSYLCQRCKLLFGLRWVGALEYCQALLSSSSSGSGGVFDSIRL